LCRLERLFAGSFRLRPRRRILIVAMSDVTQILQQIESGDPSAAAELLPLVYEELRKLAAARMAQESPDHTLQATALVHEAYVKLVGAGSEPGWQNRRHFFMAAAEAMRRILIDHARRKQRVKHGGDRRRVALDGVEPPVETRPDELLLIDEALERLENEDPQAAEVVKLCYFGGLEVEEAADLLGISRATAYRHWNYARAWLHAEVARDR
jgi:RNA polymerase sigma factor (TIGR02999 family)